MLTTCPRPRAACVSRRSSNPSSGPRPTNRERGRPPRPNPVTSIPARRYAASGAARGAITSSNRRSRNRAAAALTRRASAGASPASAASTACAARRLVSSTWSPSTVTRAVCNAHRTSGMAGSRRRLRAALFWTASAASAAVAGALSTGWTPNVATRVHGPAISTCPPKLSSLSLTVESAHDRSTAVVSGGETSSERRKAR